MPPGVKRDLYAGSTGRPGLPYAGTFTEVNVRLYSRDAAGRHGVVFLSLDAGRLVFVLAARTGGVPYVRSRRSTRPGTPEEGSEGPPYANANQSAGRRRARPIGCLDRDSLSGKDSPFDRRSGMQAR